MHSAVEPRRSVLLSATAHATVVLALLLLSRLHPPVLAPKHLPGTAQGTEIMLSYQLPGAPPGAADSHASAATPRPRPAPAKPADAPKQKATQLTAPAPVVSGDASEGSLGDGDMTIALVQFHPRPEPDLSTLAPGSSGDIVLDAVIDSQGRIAHLSVVKSLGEAVDRQVVATIKQWTFSPAMRSGLPIESEQEILIHYERSAATPS